LTPRPPAWVTLKAYAERYDVDPRTVKKWAEAGLVQLLRVRVKGKRPLVRVENQPPHSEGHR
jgi:hypothetical protein